MGLVLVHCLFLKICVYVYGTRVPASLGGLVYFEIKFLLVLQ